MIEVLRIGEQVPDMLLNRALLQKYLTFELRFSQDRSQLFVEDLDDITVVTTLTDIDKAIKIVPESEYEMSRAIDIRQAIEGVALEQWPNIYKFGW